MLIQSMNVFAHFAKFVFTLILARILYLMIALNVRLS